MYKLDSIADEGRSLSFFNFSRQSRICLHAPRIALPKLFAMLNTARMAIRGFRSCLNASGNHEWRRSDCGRLSGIGCQKSYVRTSSEYWELRRLAATPSGEEVIAGKGCGVGCHF
ncbi:unnamed protein product [Linum trigynum]|uniref:Uncharacterized protein n=1 Tax=Linum trigynum TaxID=586398 RepID=A0AAV2CUU0_9ROSI